MILVKLNSIIGATLVLLACPLPAADSCAVQIPSSLEVPLHNAFAKFRAPLSTDNLAGDIEWDLNAGRSGCLGVASADFDGDGTRDLLLGLTALSGSGALIVVALARGKNWKLETLDAWPAGRSRLYVAVGKPGVYQRTEALGGALEPCEMDPLTCSHSAALFGATESTGVVYCYDNVKWQHVWIAD